MFFPSPLFPSDRFRQLDVFQQVTTAFSSLVESASIRTPQNKQLPPEALERRRHVAMMYRRASKNSKSHSITTSAATTAPCVAPELQQPPALLGDKTFFLKRATPDHIAGPELQAQCQMPSLRSQGGAPRHWPTKDSQVRRSALLYRKKITESFEMDEAS